MKCGSRAFLLLLICECFKQGQLLLVISITHIEKELIKLKIRIHAFWKDYHHKTSINFLMLCCQSFFNRVTQKLFLEPAVELLFMFLVPWTYPGKLIYSLPVQLAQPVLKHYNLQLITYNYLVLKLIFQADDVSFTDNCKLLAISCCSSFFKLIIYCLLIYISC